jgi:hypothetical protein
MQDRNKTDPISVSLYEIRRGVRHLGTATIACMQIFEE